MNNSEFQNYVSIAKTLDDSEIMKIKTEMSYKRFLLMEKYGLSLEEFLSETYRKENKLYFRDNLVFNFKWPEAFVVDIVEAKEDVLLIEGRTTLSYYLDDYKICIEEISENKVYEAKTEENKAYNKDVEIVGKDGLRKNMKIFTSYKFKFNVPITDRAKYRIKVESLSDGKEMKCVFRYKKFGKLNEELTNSYFTNDEWILKLIKGSVHIYRKKLSTLARTEIRWTNEIKKQSKSEAKEILKLRKAYWICNALFRKKIWLISDRPHIAGDNGEAFFSYAVKMKSREIKPYFLISEQSPDYERIKALRGNVIKFGSFKHKLFFLLADKLISSSADDWLFDLMKDIEYGVKDLYKFDYVFLQHGIIQKDFSKWLNKCRKNIKVFVTSAKPEFKSIVDGDYGYSEKEVKLTRLPRYDNLKSESKKMVSVMPTWRQHIVAAHVPMSENSQIKVRGYSESFKYTEYYRFYQSILNDDRLNAALKKSDYTCHFYLHPSFSRQIIDFNSKYDTVVIHGENADYNRVFKESSLLVTDYSSVAMDFAYLKKPVIYAQFDKEDFLNNHTGKEGYFDYETYGFGDVFKSVDEVVDKIIEYIKGGCVMEDLYIDRVENFFAYNDHENCRRVYEEILNL